MTPQKEIGECLISSGEDDYFFRPSFAAMSRIGEPQEIVQAFYDLHNDEITPLIQRAMDAYGSVPAWLMAHLNRKQMGKPAMMAAMSVLAACCESDVSRLTGDIIPGKSGKWAFVYRAGLMNAVEMVLIAQSLITHGIIGKAKVRQLQRHESSQATTEFRSFDYISAARNHFGISRAEAEQLSMTEFQLMLNAKYPDQKGFTRDEYEAVADDYLSKKARRLAKAKQ
ncbi:hypothetical protein MZUP3_150 [Erwinia phage vB_EhrS_49]|uniref:Uncharacterized protein n=2 Tax=Feofaniavirus TaxID=2733174 RepID=A0A4Y1NRC9_9CAUD|nr:DUF6246 family protein [Erwinia phage vB_EhrS_49]YP_009824045.1 DUF6246 family protein [Erwinia phage vB_EhrS_59]AXH43445.1 hypothetical protein MZUP3_150 [Erwinia phage vB_EhrS_49]AXH43533.1 hypothetical protein MZUP2_150 [Erwinia phage vB_EhrS_59]